MTKQSTVLAVRLRQAQWLLDDLAFDAGADRLDSARIAEAATTLSRLTLLLTSGFPGVKGELAVMADFERTATAITEVQMHVVDVRDYQAAVLDLRRLAMTQAESRAFMSSRLQEIESELL